MGTGFSGMVLDLILLFTFQNIYGYVFHQIGLLITAFMAGLAIGGFAMTKYIHKPEVEVSPPGGPDAIGTRARGNELRLLIIVELAMIIFALILPLVFILLQDYITGGLGQAVFLVLACVGGGVIGAEFPLVVKIYEVSPPARGKISATAGLIYGADLLGGWLGGIAGGVLLLPVIGITQTIIVIIAIKLASIAFLCLIPPDQRR
jgi:spermidine synthase